VNEVAAGMAAMGLAGGCALAGVDVYIERLQWSAMYFSSAA